MAAKANNYETPVYEEFEPLIKWQRKEDQDILEIHLQEFKKEQLKVQISNQGFLKISGERPLDASKHTRFYKEVPVPCNKYDTNAIHAKFGSGNLKIILPKVKISTPEINKEATSPEPSKVDQTPRSGPTTGAPDVGGGPVEQAPTHRAKVGSRMAKVAVSLAAVLVAYVVYMYMKSAIQEINDYKLMDE